MALAEGLKNYPPLRMPHANSNEAASPQIKIVGFLDERQKGFTPEEAAEKLLELILEKTDNHMPLNWWVLPIPKGLQSVSLGMVRVLESFHFPDWSTRRRFDVGFYL